jgi:hypothetical protein
MLFPKYAIMPIVKSKNNAHVPPFGKKAIVWRCASFISAAFFCCENDLPYEKITVDQTTRDVGGSPSQSAKKGTFI